MNLDIFKNFSGMGYFKVDQHLSSDCTLFIEIWDIHYQKVKQFVYALMSDKRTERIFEMIKPQIPGWSPQKYHKHFETAASNALTIVS